MKYLGIDPGIRKSMGYVVVEIPLERPDVVDLLAWGVFDLRRIPLRVAASSLAALAKRHGVSEALIEDFFYFGGREKGRAPWALVAEMRKTIGYLSGFLAARGIPTDLVPPRRWKNAVEPELVEGLLLEGGVAKPDTHVVSALGVVLGELAARRREVFGEEKQKSPRRGYPRGLRESGRATRGTARPYRALPPAEA